MPEYVEKKAIRDALCDADAITMEGVKILNQFPAADVTPVVHGRWNRPFLSGTKRKNPFCYCTNCAYPVQPKRMSNYCPSCGAKMDLEG